MLYHLADAGTVTPLPVGRLGEIYDILPWDDALMPGISAMLARQPLLDLEGEFPPRRVLPPDYGGPA